MNKTRVVAVLGPTATGKSDLGVALAHEFDGEVISADSRQVYRGLDIGTGKITQEEMKGVPHHLLDIRDPGESYSASEFKEDAQSAIDHIHRRQKLPILVGGTGFFVASVVDNLSFPDVPPNPELRKLLEEKPTERLYELLRMRDANRAETIDPYNRRRLIRALEIAEAHGNVPRIEKQPTPFDTLQIGLVLDADTLKQRIQTRLKKRIDEGMIDEARRLHENGLSYERMDELGLEYRYIARYLQGIITEDEMVDRLETEIWRYAKRQHTWFRRDARIEWFTPDQREEIFERVRSFLRT